MTRRLTRWSWQDLSAEEMELLAAELVMWVEWLRKSYQLHEIRSCWFTHEPLRLALTALMSAWKSAYECLEDDEAGDVPTDEQAAWHEHFFWPFVRHIPLISDMSSCMEGCVFEDDGPPVDDEGWRVVLADLIDRHAVI